MSASHRIAMALACAGGVMAQAPEATRAANRVPGLGGIPTCSDWGGTRPISYLGEALRALGLEVTDDTLAAAGGEAFGFTYVAQPVDEPQRDHWPNDIFADAAAAFGYDLRWVTDAGWSEVKRLVKEEIDAGRPVLTHSLDLRQHHGFHLIAGYDHARNMFLLCPHGQGKPLVEAPIPAVWHGAVPGPRFWATNPLGLLRAGSSRREPTPGELLRTALDRATRQWAIESFPFGAYPWDPSTHFDRALDLSTLTAPFGWQAFECLLTDILTTPAIHPRLIWRLDAQLERFGYNRQDAVRFLRRHAVGEPEGSRRLLESAATLYERDLALAVQLMECFWNHSFYALPPATAAELTRLLTHTPSLVFGGVERLPEAATDGLELGRIERSVWGPVILVDQPARRHHAAALVRQLQANEEEAIRLLRKRSQENRGS